MIEAERLAISNAKREVGNNKKNDVSRVIRTLNEFGTLARWNKQYVKSNYRDILEVEF